MIPFDFGYYRPDTITEALDVFFELDRAGKAPVYYGGGTELISMSRVGNLRCGAVIDIKSIPDCGVLGFIEDRLLIGCARTLSDISESGCFPLLGKTAGRIADHTMQCKITLGGNLASTIIYRETAMPLLLADARLTVANKSGLSEVPISQVFKDRLTLHNGEFLVKAAIEKKYVLAPYVHVKKTKNEKIAYPLMTACALRVDGHIRISFSGLATYPFRDPAVEAILNNTGPTHSQRADEVVHMLSDIILSDSCGSAEYRKYVLKNTVMNILETLKDQLPCIALQKKASFR